MKDYSGSKAGDMACKVKDYQPPMKQFAGEMTGKANMYMERHDRMLDKEASQVRKQAHKGRYD